MALSLKTIAEHIQELELKLLQTDLKVNPALINELLSDEFEEISNNGQMNSRADVVHWLLTKDSHVHWFLLDFRIKVLTDDLVMAIYRAGKSDDTKNMSEGSIRTSLWKYQAGRWKMLFHQASKQS